MLKYYKKTTLKKSICEFAKNKELRNLDVNF